MKTNLYLAKPEPNVPRASSLGHITRRGFLSGAGFTLIEIILAVAIIGLIATGIYSVASGTVELSSEVAKSQQQEILIHNFLRLLRRNFEGLPGNGGVTLQFQNNGRHEETDVMFLNYPLAFHWPSVPAGSNRVVLMSKANSRGSMDVILVYLDNSLPADVDYRSLLNSGRLQGATILPLLTDVTKFQWQFLDESLSEEGLMVPKWEDPSRRPSIVELTLQFYGRAKDEFINAIFWIPPMVNPEQFFRSSIQPSQPGGGGGGQPPPGGGGGPPGGGGPGGGPAGPGGGGRPGGGPGGGGRGGR